MLGLNKEPSQFPRLSPTVAEVRRRVWWYLFYVDICVAIAAGLPPLIENAFTDVRPLSELKDIYIGTPQAREYEEALASTNQHPLPVPLADRENVPLVSFAGLYTAGKYGDCGMSSCYRSRRTSG